MILYQIEGLLLFAKSFEWNDQGDLTLRWGETEFVIPGEFISSGTHLAATSIANTQNPTAILKKENNQ